MAAFSPRLLALGLAIPLATAACGDNDGTGGFSSTTPDFNVPGENENGPGTDAELFVPNPGPDEGLSVHRFVANPGEITAGPIHAGGNLVWGSVIEGRSAIRTSDKGGSSWVLFPVGEPPRVLVGDDVGLFFTGGESRVFSYSYDSQTGFEILSLDAPVTGLAVDSEELFVATANGQVYASDRSGTEPALIADVGGLIHSMKRDGEYLYFATLAADGGNLFRVNVMRDSLDTELVAGGFDFDSGFMVDGEYTYWGDAQKRAIMRVWSAGGEPAVVAAGQYQVGSLTGERFLLYFANGADGVISAVPKTGGEVVPLVEESGARNLQLIDERLYWTNDGPASLVYVDL